jgi:hypothetical protein
LIARLQPVNCRTTLRPRISLVFYSVVVQGIALQAQHGETTEELLHVVGVAMDSWPAKTPV